MSLRWKIALAMAAVVAVTALAFGAASYQSTRQRLLNEVDRSLLDIEQSIRDRRLGTDSIPERGPFQGFDAQLLGPDGSIRESTFRSEFPVGASDREVIGTRSARFSNVSTADGEFRVRTVGFSRGAVQVARSLQETDRVLASLRVRTLLLGGFVSALAAALGLWIAGRVTASLRRLTAAAEHIESTGALDVDVAVDSGSDEVGRLSTAFAGMISSLSRSRAEQERLVQDAGHELRTPLTSMRTNLDVLRRFPDLASEQRAEIIDDLHDEAEELTSLVNEVVAVASGDGLSDQQETFDLLNVAHDVADRFHRRTGRDISVHGAATMLTAQRAAVHRAVSCLVDNACKFDESGGLITVTVTDGEVVVADQGPGIPESDLGHIFDRFHRSDAARTLPGSGLGLSIVAEVAQRHGGEAFARNRPDGGAAIGFRLGRTAR